MPGWWAEDIRAPHGATLTITGGQPAVSVSASRFIQPQGAVLTATGGRPDKNVICEPDSADITTTGGRPNVNISNHKVLQPSQALLVAEGETPDVAITQGRLIQPAGRSLAFTGGAANVVATKAKPTLVGVNVIDSTSVSIPTHQKGDGILLFVYRSNNNAIPAAPAAGGTVPAWVDVEANAGSNTNSLHVVQFVATGSSHTSGTWTTAAIIMAVVVRGQTVAFIGDHESDSGNAIDVTTPALVPIRTDGYSLLLHAGFQRLSSVAGWDTAPTGYTRRASLEVASGAPHAYLNTKDVTTSDGSATQVSGRAATSGYCSATIEVLGT